MRIIRAIVLAFCMSAYVVINAHSALTLKVASYNIRRKGKESKEERLWDKGRKERVVQLIKKINVDFIGMQEATKDQITDLAVLLPAYKNIGEGRGASWGGLGADEATPIFYKSSDYELLYGGTFRIDKVRGWIPFWTPFAYKKTGWLPRVCTWGKFKHTKTGKQFFVYNTHLDNLYDAAREMGAKVVKEDMGDKSPIILTGDFNIQFTDYLAQVFDDFEHAADIATRIVGPEATRTGWEDDELKQIDHILLQKGMGAVTKFKVIEEEKPYSSDHRPVIATIVLK